MEWVFFGLFTIETFIIVHHGLMKTIMAWIRMDKEHIETSWFELVNQSDDELKWIPMKSRVCILDVSHVASVFLDANIWVNCSDLI